MLPLYTHTLTNAEYGEIDLIVQTCNLIIPVISAGMMNAVIRFGLEKSIDKKSIFSVSLLTIIFGLIVLFAAMPMFANIPFVESYLKYAYVYVLVAVWHSLCSNFVRSQEMVKLYAFDGILRTTLTIVLNIIFNGKIVSLHIFE